MEEINILQLIYGLLPALIVGFISYYFFHSFMQHEEQRRKYLLHKENQKETLPIRLQAYERFALFLERIAPGNLLIRIKPYNDNKEDYAELLIKTIEQEFEHNLAQQIYVSQECWNVIKASKNATITNIRKTSKSEAVPTASELRQNILTNVLEQQSPSETGLSYIKNEISKIF